MKAEYWSSINTREWDISLKKLETGATLKASTGDSESVVATFSEGLNSKNLQLKMNDDIFLYEFLIDQDNRVIETRQTKNGTPTWRLIFTRDKTGNQINRNYSEAMTYFGETIYRDRTIDKRAISYKKTGIALARTERPADLDGWLASKPEAPSTDDSQEAIVAPAILNDSQKMIGEWEGTFGLFTQKISMNEDMTCSWSGIINLSGKYKLDETEKSIAFDPGIKGIESFSMNIGSQILKFSYEFQDDDTIMVSENNGAPTTLRRVKE